MRRVWQGQPRRRSGRKEQGLGPKAGMMVGKGSTVSAALIMCGLLAGCSAHHKTVAPSDTPISAGTVIEHRSEYLAVVPSTTTTTTTGDTIVCLRLTSKTGKTIVTSGKNECWDATKNKAVPDPRRP